MSTNDIKVIMIGALSIRYIWDNWVVPIRKLFKTTVVDVSPILSVNRNTNFIEKYIYKLLREDNYDYMFFYSDAINPDFSDGFFETVRTAGIPILNFLADDEPEIWYNQNLPYDHRYDLVATHSKNGYQRRQEMGKAGNFIYLPWGYSEDLFDRVPGVQPEYDVVYIGSNLCQEHDPNLYFSDGKQRQKLLVTVYEFCETHGLKFKVFGAGWHRHPILNRCNGGLVTNEQMVKIYSQAKIILNPGYSADDKEMSSYQTKLRHFEVAGCGAFQLVNHNPELEELFKPGEDIVYFHDTNDMKEKILFYTQHEAHRKTIADSIYQKRHLHTTTYRLQELFKQAMNRYPLKSKKNDAIRYTPRVKTLLFKSLKETKEELKKIKDITTLYAGYDAVHIITGDLQVHNVEYSTWKTSTPIENLPITATRTYLQLASLYVNPIQRKKQNMLGIILNEKVKKSSLHPWLLDYFKNNLLLLEDDENLYPIMNMLIPMQFLEKVIDIFLKKDITAFKSLPIVNSGLIITDVEMKPGILPEELTNPPYIQKLREILEEIKGRSERLMIYGAKGNMTDYVLKLLSSYPEIEITGFIDRSMAGQKVKDIPVYKYEDIERLNPTIIIIAAETSGFAIYESIKHIETKVALIPLHDLTDSIWKVLLP